MPSEKLEVYLHYSNFLKRIEVVLFLKMLCGQYRYCLIMQGKITGLIVSAYLHNLFYSDFTSDHFLIFDIRSCSIIVSSFLAVCRCIRLVHISLYIFSLAIKGGSASKVVSKKSVT